MPATPPLAILLADLGYGDAGKGSLVDYLTRQQHAHTVIRYNGGAQAAHNVITPDGRHHTFAQFGSGSFLPGVRTHLSRFMITHPLALLAEERHLRSLGVRNAFARLSLDRQSLITTPFQQSANRIRELARGGARHGSCGMGVGETMSDWLQYGPQALFAGDLHDRPTLLKKLTFLRQAKLDQLAGILDTLPPGDAQTELDSLRDPRLVETTADLYMYFASLVNIVDQAHLAQTLAQPGATIFEGAQGVLLDEWYGFYPYNSWSTLTFKNANTLLAESAFAGQVLKFGLLRGYATRHGAGPFVTEDAQLSETLRDAHNTDNPWQRDFRVGHFDLVTARYALQLTGPINGLVLTNLDRLASIPAWQTCDAYQPPAGAPDLPEYFELAGSQVSAIKLPPDPTDLQKQARLTHLLGQMQPIYTHHPRETNTYIEFIAHKLHLPLAITSHRPTARDKTWHLPITT